MAEISREEVIEYFKRRIKVEKSIVSLQTCDKEVAERKKKHIAIFEQAISDMKKLEKIEQIISDISDYEYEDCEFDMRMIEKIVKGE